MKKRLIKLITLILSVIIGIAGLSGCRLVTKNSERDYNQIVATVNVNQEENIYKKDLIMGYMNYGYMYVQYYGYTAEKVYNLILNGLIDNRIVVQVAYKDFEETSVKDETKAKYTPERYLDEDEIIEAKYNTYKSINDFLDAYSDDNSYTEKKDTLIMDVRTVPTDAQNAEKDVDKEAYVKNIDDNGFDVAGSDYKRAAFNKVYNLLKNANLLGDGYKGDIRETEYFKMLLKSNYENEIIENYEESVLADIRKSVSYENLKALYQDKLATQQNWSNSDFVDALSSASATSPILYSAFGTYGYVYNLLLGINDYQSEKIQELQHERSHEGWSEAEYAEERAEILSGTIAQDLRSSWILSGYDFDFETKRFTGDYAFTEDSLPFKGEVNKVRDADEEHNLSAVYNIGKIDTFGLEEFTKLVNEYVYGDVSDIDFGSDDINIYYEYTRSDKPEKYDAKINELLFAFSTDPGSLNTYKGYVIKPDNNEYVKTFGDAGKALLEYAANNDGESGSYMVVASDYGYHFMFFSEVWTMEKGYADLDAYLDTLNIENEYESWDKYLEEMIKNWDDFAEENNFLYVLTNEWISAKLSDASTRSIKDITFKYRYGDKKDCTKIYKDRFADLLG